MFSLVSIQIKGINWIKIAIVLNASHHSLALTHNKYAAYILISRHNNWIVFASIEWRRKHLTHSISNLNMEYEHLLLVMNTCVVIANCNSNNGDNDISFKWCSVVLHYCNSFTIYQLNAHFTCSYEYTLVASLRWALKHAMCVWSGLTQWK